QSPKGRDRFDRNPPRLGPPDEGRSAAGGTAMPRAGFAGWAGACLSSDRHPCNTWSRRRMPGAASAEALSAASCERFVVLHCVVLSARASTIRLSTPWVRDFRVGLVFEPSAVSG